METLERLTTARQILVQAEAAVGLNRTYPHTFGAHALDMPQNTEVSEEATPEHEAWEAHPRGDSGRELDLPREGRDRGLGSGVQERAWSEQKGWAVPSSLAGVLPHGLVRGMTVGIRGSRLASLLVAGLASSQGAWVACIGIPDMSWGMALLLEMDFERVILVPEYKNRVLPQVISTAIDGFDVVLVGQQVFLDPREKRLLARRALSRKILLIGEGWESREQVHGHLVGVDGLCGGSGHVNTLNLDMFRPGERPCHVAITPQGWQAQQSWWSNEGIRAVPRPDGTAPEGKECTESGWKVRTEVERKEHAEHCGSVQPTLKVVLS